MASSLLVRLLQRRCTVCETRTVRFMPLSVHLLLSEDKVIFLCFKMTCFHDAKSQANGEQKTVTHV